MSKTKQVNIRMSIKDYDILNKQREKLKMSQVEFFSHIINNGINEIIEVSSPKLASDMDTIEKIFNRIGQNINQIATAYNSGTVPPKDVLHTLQGLDKNMKVLFSRLDELKKEKIITKGDV